MMHAQTLALSLLLSLAPLASAQVTATGTNGPNNPASPTYAAVGSSVDQNSLSRLASLNGVDDFCLFAPPSPNMDIGNAEAVVVSYCTKPRNGARLIPDGAITAAKFVKTPLYVQVSGFWDGTKVNIMAGDYGGELDPHGATGEGNPVGGNVTSNVSGRDVFYEEWMQFVSSDQFCFRICTAQNANITAALQCQHTLDLMGCNFVMALGPDQYSVDSNNFVSCLGDPAAGPGLYPQANGSTSTFAQRYTGTYTDASSAIQYFTVGVTVTPEAPAFIPATSQCTSYPTISNGVNTANFLVTASPQFAVGTPVTFAGEGSAITPSTTRVSTTSVSSSASTTVASASTSGTTRPASQTGSSSSSASTAAATSARSAAVKTEGGMNGLVIAGLVGTVGLVLGAMEVMF